ncbi:MAG TPA: diaminopimelate decarboxylase [Terriglobales bacterium]|nr:diaminopimelate decarboxylase [Terriglobales bacterium]
MNNWWENDFVTVKGNKLILAGLRADDLAARFGTPLYVYGKDAVRTRYRFLDGLLAARAPVAHWICYAMKANPHPGLLGVLRRCGARIDAVSPNEVDAALAAGFPPERILYTGTSVSGDDLERVLALDGLTVNIDAAEQLDLMAAVRRRVCPKRRVRVSVRWNPGVGRGFNPRVVTAGARSSDGTPIKFGVEERKVVPVFERARALGFEPVGLHHHLGSGWVREDFPAACEAAGKIVRKAGALEDLGHRLEFIDFGGGFGPRYTRDQGLFPVERYVSRVCRTVAGARLGLGAIAFEPGKFLVGEAGAVLLRVEYVKESYGNLFACVNGGTYNTVPRPAIYPQAFHEVVNASRVRGTPRARLTVAGNLCETGDVFGRDRLLPVPRTGEVLAVLLAGAYCRSMASTFNLRDIPREILV